ncbi:pyrimidine utilization protein D [soil metagenome]
MRVNDATIDYDVFGDGPPLLLVGGMGFGRWSWFKQSTALSRHFRVITFDIRNIGDLADEGGSYSVANLAAHAAALLDHLEVERAHVLGTSLGGFIAQELALQRPELVAKLVLISTSYGGSDHEPMSSTTLRKMLGWGTVKREDAVRQGLAVAVAEEYPETSSEEFEQMVDWRVADSPPLADYIKQMVAGAKFDASSEIEEIRQPALILHGSDDRVVPVSNAVSLSERLPDAKLHIFENAGHLVFVERADEVNEKIISFLKRRPFPGFDRLSASLRGGLSRLQAKPVAGSKRMPSGKKKSKTGKRKKGGLLDSIKNWVTRSG